MILPPTRVEISRSAVLTNISSFRSVIPEGTLLAAVVKSNAYGHGLIKMAELSVLAGSDLLAVNSIEEGNMLLKAIPDKPILVMGEIPGLLRRKSEVNNNRLWIVISRPEEAAFLNNLSHKPKIHLKTDSGMGRLGYSGEKLYTIIKDLHDYKINLHGILTHFASTEDFTEHSYSMQQLNKFQEYAKFAEEIGFTNLIKHSASSASAMLFAEARLNLVRIGISLYGLWPSIQTRLSLSLMGLGDFKLEPVLSWKTSVVHLQDVPAGTFIGYGSTFKTNYPSKIAVIPVGYYEGFDRRLSNQGYVLIHGERANLIGRVCMNMSMVDVTHIPQIRIGDEVVLIGKSGNETLSADQIASLTGTINYDVVTGIHPDIPRIVVD